MPSEPDFLLLQLGIGRVGAAVAHLVRRMAPRWRARYGISLAYYALADSSGFAMPGDAAGALTANELSLALRTRTIGQPVATLPGSRPPAAWRAVLDQVTQSAGEPGKVILVDCATGHETTEMLLAAREAGAHVVLCNKDPLTGPVREFRALQGHSRLGTLHLSATVGAGLPVVSTVAAATASGDAMLELNAVASGSLGQLCATLTRGEPFPAALQSAIDAGYCEPDPRLDLSGHDVARKLLILARLAGRAVELGDVAVESLIPAGAQSLLREAFLAALPRWHDHLRDWVTSARASGKALRYVGTIEASGGLRAGLQALSPHDPLARGHGPENVFMLRTTCYQRYPLVIAGPGAGVAVTAGAVIGDVLRATGML